MASSEVHRRQVVDVLGLPVDVGDRAAVRQFASTALADPWNGCCRHIVTLNPEYVMAARRDPEFAQAIIDADFVAADGIGVVIAARLLDRVGGRAIGRATGVDLCGWLAEGSGAADTSIFLLGGGRSVASQAASELRQRWPGVQVAGWWADGTSRPEDDEPALTRIAASGTRIVLVAYGFPGQVTWIERNRAALAAAGVRLAVGVGGALDFYAGRVPRAPRVIQRAGLEWLYRLIREPWRWRRQLALPQFAILTLAALLQRGREIRQPRI